LLIFSPNKKVSGKEMVNLDLLNPLVKAKVLQLIDLCSKHNIHIIIDQGLRTQAEQNAFYSRGREPLAAVNTKYKAAGLAPITEAENHGHVTNAQNAEDSFHGWGLAVDFAVKMPDGSILWDVEKCTDGSGVPDYTRVGQLAESIGMEWGGRWVHMPDHPHVEMRFGLSIQDLKAGKKPPTA
jgi:peptidoglycan L-alanyl-D-glutamate endopeptidase CwlK